MKRILIVPLAVLIMVAGAAASTLCPSGLVVGTLAAYEANYNGLENACLIGDKLFYNFNWTLNGGTVTPDVTQIMLSGDATNPISNPGLKIQTGEFFLFAPDTLDFTITYSVATASGSALMEDYDIVIAGGTGNTPGVGTVTESFFSPDIDSLLGGLG